MLEYIREIKEQLVSVYGFPQRSDLSGEVVPMGPIPDGYYPMEILGRLDHVEIIGDRIRCCQFDKPSRTWGAAVDKRKKGR